ncbi:3-oxoacid CoA-transferase [Xanthobacter dioxanivorans]|uniref:3-oxoacid CoA-transferase n=1 Tax=Xanthobacter dioxanivorans TaxID=2528964 RepID=A0A974SK17_9HYPH|nr:CoA-transferase [Xanthobacter dioxanivorans]QRG09026.1 3-oxoacid CoA-transferase [Xanthobacter dioxanivorans]
MSRETTSKVATLGDAVRATVTPGATLLFAFTHNRSHAAAFEVARQFRDRRCLTLAGTGLLEYASILVAAGAVERLESAFAGGTYPAPAPSRQLQAEIDACAGNDPDWTNLTMTLRLMAGAMGWPFVPTNSLFGSGLWNGRQRARITDPFTGAPASVIAPLRPDVTFLHAPVADTLGNTILHAPDAEESWGVYAARQVVVTAERVVSPETLRGIGPRTGIPGHLVAHVVHAPFGAHPQGQFLWSEDEGVESYAEDYAFRQMLRALVRDPGALRAWVEEWVFGTDHAAYLDRLGAVRLDDLRAEAVSPIAADPKGWDEPASPEERAAALAMTVAEGRVAANAADTLFAGIGLAHLAAWGAERRCRARQLPVSLIAETGMIGFRPIAGDPYLFNRPNAASSLFHSSFTQTLGVLAGSNARRCLAMLAAAQIDRQGNINSSRSADGRLIVGSGGANDLASGGGACLVVMPLKAGRFVEELPFVTSPIRHHAGVATDLGLLERDETGDLRVTGVTCAPGEEQATLSEISRRCGREIARAPDLVRFAPPTPDDLALLRGFDPCRTILA